MHHSKVIRHFSINHKVGMSLSVAGSVIDKRWHPNAINCPDFTWSAVEKFRLSLALKGFFQSFLGGVSNRDQQFGVFMIKIPETLFSSN
jgi:hypothetical protein